jgi:hypothetical protein
MEVELITLYLAMKHLRTIVIHRLLNRDLILAKRSFADPFEATPEEPEIGESNLINNIILRAPDEYAFAPILQLAKQILIPRTTIQCHLVNRMGFKLTYCRWISHKPSATQKQNRAAASEQLLDLLRSVHQQE